MRMLFYTFVDGILTLIKDGNFEINNRDMLKFIFSEKSEGYHPYMEEFCREAVDEDKVNLVMSLMLYAVDEEHHLHSCYSFFLSNKRGRGPWKNRAC